MKMSNYLKKMKKNKNVPYKNALIYGISSAMTQFLMMIYLILIAKWLGSDKYGYIAAAYAATSMSAFVFNWGLNEWMMKAGTSDEKPELLGGKVIIIKTILGVIWGTALFISLRSIRPELYLINVLFLSIVDVLLDSIFGSLIVIFLLKNKTKVGSYLLIFSRAIRLISGIVIILIGYKSILLVQVVRTSSTLLAVFIAWLLTKPTLVLNKTQDLLPIFKKSIYFNISELINLIFLHADVNILSLMGASSELIGNYSIVINLINAIIMLPAGIYNALLPSLIQTYRENLSSFFRKVKNLFISFLLIGLFLGLSVAILSKPIILSALGQDFQNSADLLLLLSPLLILRSLTQANIAYLIIVGWQAKRILPQSLATIIKIGIGSLLFPLFDVNGLVLITIISECVLIAGYMFHVYRHRLGMKRKTTEK
jgi:O-antigen/teichoic acid export membrane protein